MGLSVKEQVSYWGVAAVIFVAAVWFLGNTLLPFVVGAGIAYFLDPVADRLEEWGCSRVLATIIVTLVMLIIFIALMLIVIPLLISQVQLLVVQTQGLIEKAPEYFAQLESRFGNRFTDLFQEGSWLRNLLASMQDSLKSGGLALANTLLSSSLAVIDFLILAVVAPVVAFYLLMDWDRMIARIDDLLPREHAPVIRKLAGEMDSMLGNFVRGQLSVCAILGAFYSIGLVLVGLQFGLIVGFFAGLISFIPFVGSIIGGTLSVGLALFQFWDQPILIGVVAVIFVVGQMVEGNVLTPMLVGGSVGLHPVWLMLALSVFGSIFGFVGLLIAVPVAALIGVMTRFALEQYRSGRLYQGPQPKADG